MSSALSIRTVRDSADIELSVRGVLSLDANNLAEIILQPKSFKDCKFAKLNALFYALEEGLTVILYWEHDGSKNEMMLPLSGRGILDLERFGGLENPKLPGHTGNVILVAERTSPGKKHFVLGLEFSKQRS